MSVDRQLLLVKLFGFSTGEISKNEIYEWALFTAVSADYEALIKNDQLVEQIMQFLLDIDKPRTTPAPTKKIIEYFIACLESKKQFSETDYKALISEQSDKPAAPAAAVKPAKAPPPVPASAPAPSSIPSEKPSTKVSREVFSTLESVPQNTKKPGVVAMLARIYVFLFVAVSLALNLLVIFKPNFLMNEGEVAPLPDEVLRDAFPHLIYAVAMMLALVFKGPRLLFYFFFFIAAWGMFFYWYSITIFIFDNKWPLYYLVMLSPILTIPPTMMFCIMLTRWFDLTRRK